MTTTLATPQPHHPAPPVTEHTDRADDDVWHELAEHGLRRYTARTAAAVGAGPGAAWSEWADAPRAYIALEGRLPDHPDRDAALIWAAEHGWAVAVETGCGEDLLITASLDGDVLPEPEAVAAFVRAELAGRRADMCARTRAAAAGDCTRRLVDWAGRESPLEDQTG